MSAKCIFCGIAAREIASEIVFEDDFVLAFLDDRPLFPGHVLVIPRVHAGTLLDLPEDMIGPLFKRVQSVTRAVEKVMEAQGSFVAINNRVSQSVPHLHVHVVPRRQKDGLKGFFWPRNLYAGPEEMKRIADALRAELSARGA